MPQTRRRFFESLAAAAVGGLGLGAAGSVRAQDDIDGLNVFISPCGQPFRAAKGAPYPVVAWFKQADANGDGKIDHAEFLADAAAFFKTLDRNGDGIINPQEVAYYERRICPEIIGLTYEVGALSPNRVWAQRRGDARIWPAQFTPGGMDDVPTRQVDTNIEPLGKQKTLPIDESKQGASPFSFFDEPEPVATADLDFNGKITKANFLRLADVHFTALDPDGAGFLVLNRLPKTAAQRRIEHPHRR